VSRRSIRLARRERQRIDETRFDTAICLTCFREGEPLDRDSKCATCCRASSCEGELS
jgi:hypothetical protein